MRKEDCPHCAELREEIAWLKGELGLVNDLDKITSVRSYFKLAPQEAKLLLALNGSYPRPLSNLQIEERIEHPNDGDGGANFIRCLITRIRTKLTFAALETVWGAGYKLTPQGRSSVEAALKWQASREEPRSPPGSRVSARPRT